MSSSKKCHLITYSYHNLQIRWSLLILFSFLFLRYTPSIRNPRVNISSIPPTDIWKACRQYIVCRNLSSIYSIYIAVMLLVSFSNIVEMFSEKCLINYMKISLILWFEGNMGVQITNISHHCLKKKKSKNKHEIPRSNLPFRMSADAPIQS